MDGYLKRYYHYEKDEHGSIIKVASMISRKNPEHSEAFECDQNVILARSQLKDMENKKRKAELQASTEEDKQRRKREREELDARKARGEIDGVEIQVDDERISPLGLAPAKKCCCGRSDNYHKDNTPSGVKVNHTCERCQKKCYIWFMH